MEKAIKKELHELIDSCDNEYLLAEAKEVLVTDKAVDDWWDELTEEDKNLLKESEAQYERGEFITNAELMKQFEEWRKR